MRGPTAFQTAQNFLDNAAREGIAKANVLPRIIDDLVDVTGKVAGCYACWHKDRVGAQVRLEGIAIQLRLLADQVEDAAKG